MAERKVQRQREVNLNNEANLPKDIPDQLRETHLKSVRVRDHSRRPPTRKEEEIVGEGREDSPETA